MSIASLVMVVDGNPTSRHTVSGMLKHLGYNRLVEVDDGETVCDRLRETGAEVVVCDRFVHDMSGLDILDRVRADRELGETPFIMIFQPRDRAGIIEGTRRGLTSYLVSPFRAMDLADKLSRILD
ncbi:MAG: response regulator [Desulfatibacillaceae bacterium]